MVCFHGVPDIGCIDDFFPIPNQFLSSHLSPSFVTTVGSHVVLHFTYCRVQIILIESWHFKQVVISGKPLYLHLHLALPSVMISTAFLIFVSIVVTVAPVLGMVYLLNRKREMPLHHMKEHHSNIRGFTPVVKV